MSKIRVLLACIFVSVGIAWFSSASPSLASTSAIDGTDFETDGLASWTVASQTGSLNATITGGGTGVSLIGGAVTFNAGNRAAVGSPTLSDGSPNPYYAPAVTATTWSFSPFGTKAAALQPAGQVQFDGAMSALGLTASQNQALKDLLVQQRTLSGLGSPTPYDAAWITKDVELTADVTYVMSWNYIGTDYVPFNDGSITSLVYLGSSGTPTVTVNNGVGNYALLGFTNPGTGDYSTGSFGSTGWQVSTYKVSVTGSYRLGFAVFNLGDSSLSPVLLVDNQPGSTLKGGEPFNAVAPNNPNAPSVGTTTTTVAETTTTTTTTEAPALPPIIYIPPIQTTEPETTTSTVAETTTTLVETTTTTSVGQPVTLPVTGQSQSGNLVWATAFLLLGICLTFGIRGNKRSA